MSVLRLIIITIILIAGVARGTQRMALRAELEGGHVCYQRYGAQLWKAFVGALPAATAADPDALAAKATLFRELLRNHVAPCTAIARVTSKPQSVCPDPSHRGALLMCLNLAHSAARGAALDPVERERAVAANAQQVYTTREEALTYSSDAASYTDPATREAVARAVAKSRRRR
jgi:hypothetical protein